MTLIIEKPNADAERTTRTPGSPCRLTVNGYVIWSSTSCGDRPDQSVNTITWLSERSGIASIGVVRSAQYPHPPRRRKAAMTRTRFRRETSISQLIIDVALVAVPIHPGPGRDRERGPVVPGSSRERPA